MRAVEGEVLAGPTGVLVGPLEADGMVALNHSPRGDSAGSDLGAWSVGGGDASMRISGGPVSAATCRSTSPGIAPRQ